MHAERSIWWPENTSWKDLWLGPRRIQGVSGALPLKISTCPQILNLSRKLILGGGCTCRFVEVRDPQSWTQIRTGFPNVHPVWIGQGDQQESERWCPPRQFKFHVVVDRTTLVTWSRGTRAPFPPPPHPSIHLPQAPACFFFWHSEVNVEVLWPPNTFYNLTRLPTLEPLRIRLWSSRPSNPILHSRERTLKKRGHRGTSTNFSFSVSLQFQVVAYLSGATLWTFLCNPLPLCVQLSLFGYNRKSSGPKLPLYDEVHPDKKSDQVPLGDIIGG